MFVYALLFLAGALSQFIVDSPRTSLFLVGLAISSWIFVQLLPLKWAHIKVPARWFLAGLIWANSSIVIWQYANIKHFDTPQTAQVAGSICSIPIKQFDSWRFDFCVDSIDDQTLSVWQRDKFKATWNKYAEPPKVSLAAGQSWRFNAKIKPIHGRVNPDAFDYEKWLVAEGYRGTISVRKNARLSDSDAWSSHFHRTRQSVYNYLSSLLPDSPNQGLLLAILLGERAGISDEQWQVFQDSGTSHLLAISGLHVGIAALWAYWLVQFLWRLSATLCRWQSAQFAAEIASLLAAVAIVLLSGLGLPAQRALIMLTLYLFARWSGRHYSLFSLLGMALVIILVLQPFAVLSVSFWLSFSAVFIIATVISRRMAIHRWLSWLQVNWYLYLALIPIGWMFFGKISWVALVANIILIPIASFVLTPLLYLGALISVFTSKVATFIFWLADQVMSVSFWIQKWLASVNTELLVANDSITLVALLLLFLWVILPRKLMSVATTLPIGLLLLLPSTVRTQQDFSAWVFDVGHGLAVYVETPQGNLVYDTAWGDDDFATINSTLLPHLKQKGIRRIDKVIISHADSDHRGGLTALLTDFDIAELISGEKLPNHKSHNCHSYPSWQWGEATFSFLSHTAVDTRNEFLTRGGNNRSCVLAVSYAGQNILFTGDIEKAAERRLIKAGLARHDFLVAPHHGSKTSSTEGFIQSVQPSHVIFSTGYANQWNFPRPEVVNRYRLSGSQIWITHRDGAISIQADKSRQLRISSLRQSEPQFWR